MHIEKRTLRNIFIGVFGCIILYWILHETARVKATFKLIFDIVSPFALGAALAFILNVPMRAFEKLYKKIKSDGLRRAASLLTTIFALLLVLALVFWLLIPQVIETVQSLIPKLNVFFTQIEASISNFLKTNPQLMEWLRNTGLEKLNLGDLVQKSISILGTSVSTILSGALYAIGNISGALVDVVIAIVFAIYSLFQKETLARQGRKLIYAYLPEHFCDNTIRVLRLTNSTFSNFLSGQCIEVVILGCMFAISMAIFGMPYIPLVSVLVAVTAFIPVVGAWVGCVLGAFLILVANPLQAVWFVVMFLVLQQIENNLIYPRVVGTSIGLSGMWVLVAVAVGGQLMGVAGMFLMIPVTSVVYTLLREAINNRLQGKVIDPVKLTAQPLEIEPKFKKIKKNKKKQKNEKQNP